MFSFYFFRFFLLVYFVTFLTITIIFSINELLFALVGEEDLQRMFLKIIDFVILFWSLILSFSFVVAFCIYFIKFSKSFEFTALRSLGISYRKIYTPIFYFSIFCGMLIYINQSYFAPYRGVGLLKNYENPSSDWALANNKISYFKQNKNQITEFFLLDNSSKIEKIDITNQQQKKEILISDEQIIEKEVLGDFNLQKKLEGFFLEEKNFFYLRFEKLYPLIKKNDLFLYIFFQKIADMLIPIFLFFIFLGRPLHPRNTDLEEKMVYSVSICMLFILTNQLGIFLFKANANHPFFYAFFNHIFYGSFLLFRYLKNGK